MKTLIICKLSEVFIIPQITTEKDNRLRFTKGTTEVDLSEENIKKLEDFIKPYVENIKIVSGEETDGINKKEVVDEINKETELKNKKALLFSELEELKNNLKEVEKKEIIEKFRQFITDEKSKKEELVSQIEENIEKLEG